MKPVKTYCLQVDMYRNDRLFRKDAKDCLYRQPGDVKGTYFVGAKSQKEACQLLQKHIGFGDISVPWCQSDIPDGYNMPYKRIKKYQAPSNI